jgi:hypothetical protein
MDIEMIRLFNYQNRKVALFKSYDEMAEYFNNREKTKVIVPNNVYKQEKWILPIISIGGYWLLMNMRGLILPR